MNNGKLLTVSFVCVIDPATGKFDRDASMLNALAGIDTCEKRLVVDQDLIATMFFDYMTEPKRAAARSETVSTLLGILWSRFERSGKAPNIEEDPEGYNDTREWFESCVKNYLRGNTDAFQLGEGRGASVVQINYVPGEVLKDKQGNVQYRDDGTPMQKYRMKSEEWAVIVAKRNEAAAKKADKKDGAPDSSSQPSIRDPQKLLDAAAE